MGNIFIITDAGRDHDDELAFTILAGLQQQGKCRIVGAIANLHPVLERAQLIKGAFLSLGLDVPVAAGVPGEPSYQHKPYEFTAPYMADAALVEPDGQALMLRVFSEAQAKNEKITLLLISGMMDADIFLRHSAALAMSVIDHVMIMGDVKTESGVPLLDDAGFLMPGSAYNNCVDRELNPDPEGDPVGPSAKSLYAFLQRAKIPTTILSRHAAYAAYVGPEYYAGLAADGHIMADRLHKDQKAAIENLWSNIAAGTVPARLSREWFIRTYAPNAALAEENIALNGSPWPHVKSHPYDALAALAAVVHEPLFQRERYGSLDVIGLSPDRNGIADLPRLYTLMHELPHAGFKRKNIMIYPNSVKALETELAEAPVTELTFFARQIIAGAKRLDLRKAESLGVNFRYKDIVRNKDNPPSCTTEEVALASWADPMSFPLSEGEEWNKGRRATATGTAYTVLYDGQRDGVSPDEYAALPDHKKSAHVVNPYMNTGLNGRGCLGQNGPNHAVDNGLLVIRPDDAGIPTLYALGILRRYDNDAPAFAGGFAKFTKDADGRDVFDDKAVVQTKVEELFEEAISGSIPLLPEYRDRLPVALAMEVQTQALSLRNPRFRQKALTPEQIEHVRVEIETGLKLQQVKDMDPGFMERLFTVIAQGRECFSGPVLNDNRNTNGAWIETRLSWAMLDDDVWQYIRGDKPVFDYRFEAGDDASGVVYHRVDSALVQGAFASHGPMFAFMAASFVLDAQRRGVVLEPSVMNQIFDIAEGLKESPRMPPKPASVFKPKPS